MNSAEHNSVITYLFLRKQYKSSPYTAHRSKLEQRRYRRNTWYQGLATTHPREWCSSGIWSCGQGRSPPDSPCRQRSSTESCLRPLPATEERGGEGMIVDIEDWKQRAQISATKLSSHPVGHRWFLQSIRLVTGLNICNELLKNQKPFCFGLHWASNLISWFTELENHW